MTETLKTRRPHVVLAFLAGFFAVGLGYLYVGKIRFGVAAIVGLYLVVCFYAWTRLLVQSAFMLWLAAGLMLLIMLFALIHPIVVAAKDREVPVRRYNRWWVYVVWALGTIAITPIAYFSRAIVLGYETYSIPSASMLPTVATGDFVLTDSWRYRFQAPVVGEIVILERPENPGIKYIKRVVGVAGDSIAIQDGIVVRNGQQLAEPYVHAQIPYGGSPRYVSTTTLGPGMFYVLGDFRDNSLDSWQWGAFSTSSLRGRAQFVWLSLDGNKVRWDRIGIHLAP